MKVKNLICPMCSQEGIQKKFSYDAPQDVEKNFPIANQGSYWREMYCCKNCGHFLESFDGNQNKLYSEEYVSSTYQDLIGIKKAFDRINNLSPSESDNIGRVKYIDEFCKEYWKSNASTSINLLDVGAGLGVFPFQMKKIGWECTAIDMDDRLVEHHRGVVGIKSFCGDLRQNSSLGLYNLITFNKVLEHIDNPVEVLAYAGQLLSDNGLIYVELPDGEAAANEGKNREEFFIGHIHVFSFSSFALLVQKSGYQLICCERIREPSTKYTLRGFMRKYSE
ncbi:class I SAM-dependent methyltransferase [Polynucleobacter sp. MWH-UH19D]|uniref:class I SAM-dependent methyltransferase n=1 Tax=Polynucleobacter sp. MWH-UH19D TaxID=1855610 RepID=UPI003364CCFB